MEWWRQNMKKGGASSITAESHSGKMHSKIAAPSVKACDSFHSKPVAKFADGGMVDEEKLKAEGLASSKDEKVGFFERLRMGNIDDPKSEAYKRFGAGRAKMDRELDAATKEAEDLRASSAKKVQDDADFDAVDKSFAGATSVSGAQTKPVQTPSVERKPLPAPAKRITPRVTDTGDETARLAKRTKPQGVADETERLSRRYKPESSSKLAFGPKVTMRPDDGAPSIYASKEEWAAYRKRQAEKKAQQ